MYHSSTSLHDFRLAALENGSWEIKRTMESEETILIHKDKLKYLVRDLMKVEKLALNDCINDNSYSTQARQQYREIRNVWNKAFDLFTRSEKLKFSFFKIPDQNKARLECLQYMHKALEMAKATATIHGERDALTPDPVVYGIAQTLNFYTSLIEELPDT